MLFKKCMMHGCSFVMNFIVHMYSESLFETLWLRKLAI